MIKKHLVFGLGLLFSCLSFGQIALIKSNVNRDLGLISSEQKNKIWDLEDIADEKGFKEIRSIIAFIPKEGGENYFLERKLIVGSINETTKAVKAWPLTPWPYRASLSSERAASSDAKDTAGEYLNEQDYWENKTPNEFKIGSRVFWSNYFEDHHSNERYGCLGKAPLRYGAVNGDNLLVLFLRNNITFFSPQLGKTVFEYNWFNYDGDPKVDRRNNDPMVIDGLEELKGKAPQILSYSGFENMVREPFAGWTSLGKVFMGDFNNDNKADILLWRKFYSSRVIEDELKGYQLTAENWLHYQRNASGEYLPQDTSPETIQNWLSSNNLTWQKGFPSKSECAGEEGKLIPEMHDVLLNDPDVLK